MTNLLRNTMLLTTAFLVAMPLASAQSVGLDLSAVANVDGATDAVYGAQAQAEGLVGEVRGTAAGAIADAEARIDGVKADLQAEAQANAAGAEDFASQAKAALDGALAGLKGFAASITVSIEALFG